MAKRDGGSEATVSLEVTIFHPDEQMKDGYTGSVEIFTEPQTQVMMIPYEAVGQDRKNREYVMVYQGGQLERREITAGRELAEGVEILSGLQPGEVVGAGPDQLKEHQQVRLEGWQSGT